ncbi:type VI secretion system protein TssL, long form [Roseospira navarrensis]|uniref:Type VI secretion system protein TssL n=1 Tax=Roseospira navarrensis TaxID=140058 RepID=A0A7X1ZCR5_9PROT|nr:type VI secretion system protein TssL, long form [Roseospira navarrensis]MQX35937.1 type VI secretion system protein TssL [Roseospira navarrensis]
MADDDNLDPFSEPGDIDRTVIRPTPGRRGGGGNRGTTQPPTARPQRGGASGGGGGGGGGGGPSPFDDGEATYVPSSGSSERERPAPSAPRGGSGGRREAPDVGGGGVGDISATLAERSRHNPVVAAAAPLLSLIARLRLGGTHRDPDALRDRVLDEFAGFNRRLKKTDLPEDQHRTASYALAATMDDVVLNTPWGSGSIWSREGMTVCLHNEAYGGERFYNLLKRITENPGRNGRVLELFYLCLSLGFEGKMRVLDRGRSEHRRTRDGLYRLLADIRGEVPEELSPHWKGEDAGYRPISSLIPVWVIASATAALLVLMFIGFAWWLNADSDELYASYAGLPPRGAIVIEYEAPPPPPPPPPPEDVVTQGERVSGFLEPEIDEGLVTVLDDPQAITVRLRARGMFESGSDTVSDRFTAVIQRVGEALNDEQGTVVIQGHTDSIPIRTVRFPSNFDLSLARAEAVRAKIEPYLDDPSRLTVEGKAATEPIADNATAAGREANRRTDIILVKQGQ